MMLLPIVWKKSVKAETEIAMPFYLKKVMG